MQDRLIQRYLGNKSAIVPEIIAEIRKLANPGDLVFDAFAGTLSVSAAIKAAGFNVAFNDINYFTWVFGRAYLSQSVLPGAPDKTGALKPGNDENWRSAVTNLIAPYDNSVPQYARRRDIFNHYCEDGAESAFHSKRGTQGRRRFFSSENADIIDRALSRIRYWHRECDLPEETRCLLLAVLMSGVEKVSNTQGTYHDFPREYIDPRSINTISLRAPTSEHFGGPVSSCFGKAQDTLDFVASVPRHKVMYIDPPYNFRQYTAYYFMLNLIGEYPEVEDLDGYFENIEFVRGQNMESDFKSTFCNKKSFIPSLDQLVRNADCDFVVLSYFDGRNHWGEFKSKALDTSGRHELENFFRSGLFERDSLECLPLERLNYQSYGGYTATPVNEFLFVAKKSKVLQEDRRLEQNQWTGSDTQKKKVCATG